MHGLKIPDQPRELYRQGRFSRMPVIIGVNGDEGWTFVDRSFPSGLDALQYEMAVRTEFGIDAVAVLRLYPVTAFPTPKDALARLTGDVEFVCEARRVARVLHHDGAPVHFYSFEYIIDALIPGRAFHGSESNILFGNNYAPGLVPGFTSTYILTAPDLALFASMSTYWRQFAETGSPNAPGNPVPWPLYQHDPPDPSHSDRYLALNRTIREGSYLRDSPCNFWESFYFRSVVGTIPAAAR